MKTRPTDRKRRLLVLRNQSATTLLETVPQPGSSCEVARHELTPEIVDFSRACGAGRSIEIGVNSFDDSGETLFELQRPFLLVGRSVQCDLRLLHPEVSFRHAYLQVVGGRLMCVDLASRSGVHWEGGARPFGWLEPGEEISVGPFRVCCHFAGCSDDLESGLYAREGNRLPAARLEFLNAHEAAYEQRSWPIRREVTLIGSSSACKLQLRHQSVSKVHSSLVLTRHGLWVVDLLGRGGTRVNGAAVRFATLRQGDELCLGRFRMAVRLDVARASRPDDRQRRSIAISRKHGRTKASTESQSTRQKQLLRRAEPSDAFESGHLGPGTARMFSEEFVLSLVNQFASMQQQLFAQTQQQLATMTELFSSMHQSQQELIREDLLRIHEITRELQQVQSQLLTERAQAERRAAADPAVQPENVKPENDVAPQDRNAQKGPASAASPAGASVAEIFPATEKLPESGRAMLESACSQRAAELRPVESVSGTDEHHPPKSPPPEAAAETVHEPLRRNHDDVDTHAWLTERMRLLEEEREGRWQKMMRALAGAKN